MHDLGDAGGVLGGAYDDVAFHVELDDLGAGLAVRSVQLAERLSSLPSCAVRGFHEGARIDPHDLLGKDCAVSIERTGRGRHFKGVVASANVAEDARGRTHVQLNVVPALWLLSRQQDSRIYQDKAVSEVVEAVVQRHLSGRGRSVRVELSEKYEKHEYLVQYQESDYAFISRIMDREGIFFYFDHEDGHETLVLSDAVSGLQRVSAGILPFAFDPHQVPDREAVFSIGHHESVGATDAVMSGFDWTNPELEVRGEKTGRSKASPALERYQHSAVTYHKYGSRQYGEHSANRDADTQIARLDLDRKSWSLGTTAVMAAPGRVIQFKGGPEPSLDGSYLIVGAGGVGESTAGTRGSWRCDCEVIPTSMPYRAPDRGPGPIVHGLETATVVGPQGQEIHTDEHGRIKVQFHWDRQGQNDALSSCWIRVMQSWSGPGYGTFFLPRIGMEVAVSFMGGDPCRPVVIGCLYNGSNAAPARLATPDNTHSVIRTRSSPNSQGFNELRFDDTAGSERIYVHAERDFIKEVKHDRSVVVGNDERIRIDRNRESEVKGTEKVEVHGRREKLQHAHEMEKFDATFDSTYGGHRDEKYEADHKVRHLGNRSVVYESGSETFTNTHTYSAAGFLQEFQGGNAYCVTKVASSGFWRATDLGESRIWINASANEGQTEVAGSKKVVVATMDAASKIELTPDAISELSSTIKIKANTKIELKVGGNSIVINDSGIMLTTNGVSMILSAAGLVTLAPSVLTTAGSFIVTAGLVTRCKGPLWD